MWCGLEEIAAHQCASSWYDKCIISWKSYFHPNDTFNCNLTRNFSWFISKVPFDKKPALVEIMAWCPIGNKPLSGTITVFPLTHNRCEVVISWWSPLLPKISIYATKCESILEKSGIFIHLQSKYCINLSCKKNLTISWVQIAARW